MNISEINLWAIILGFAAMQGYFLAIIIFSKVSKGRKENVFLSLLLVLVSLTLTETVFGMTGLLKKWPHLIYSTSGLFFLFGPILFLYIKSAITNEISFTYKTLLHFIPFVIISIMLSEFYTLSSEQKLYYMEGLFGSSNISLRHLITWNLYIAQLFIYVFISFRIVSNQASQLKYNESGIRVVYLEELKRILILFSVYLGISIITISVLTFGKTYLGEIDLLSTLLLAFFIYWVAYKSINQPGSLIATDSVNISSSLHTSIKNETDHIKTEATKFRPSILENNSQTYINKLLKVMREQKPYLNTELKISDLAKYLNIPTHHLSQLINEEFQQNFYDFVNKYRVEEACKKLVDENYKSYSILGVALDAGFNSKSSFNRIFKKHMGMTPSTYINNHN